MLLNRRAHRPDRSRASLAVLAIAVLALAGCLKLDAKGGFPCSTTGHCPSGYQCLTVGGTPGCYQGTPAATGSGGSTTNGGAGGHGGAAGSSGTGGASAGAGGHASGGAGGKAAGGAGGKAAGGAGGAAGQGVAGVTGTAGAGGAAGGGGAPVTCTSTQHLCGVTTCVDNTSTDQCGASCVTCTAPSGGTAICSAGSCDFTCGSMKKCAASMICVTAGGCCDSSECTATSGGQTGSCDTATHTCNYTCTGNTPTACTKGGVTTCIALGSCCTDHDCASSVCAQCSSAHACVPAIDEDDPTGQCAGTCDSTGTCTSKQGQACTATIGGCVSGTFCVDNYCCNGACTGNCQACDVSGHEGTCSAVPSGAPHAARTCGGCTGISFVGAGTCSNGACASTPAPVSCPGGNVCQANACGTSCTADQSCAANYFCESNTCHPGATKVVAGEGHSCAMLFDGTIRCWGDGGAGQLGNGLINASITPVTTTGIGPISDIVAGQSHTCAILAADGSVWCWGWNEDGQLGSAVTTTVSGGQPGSATPVKVPNFPPTGLQAIALAAAYAHTCAALSDGSVWCWGSDSNEQLGSASMPATSCNGNVYCSFSPLQVTGLSAQPALLAADYGNTFVISGGGAVMGWGNGNSLGNGNMLGSLPPVSLSLTNVTAMAGATGDTAACAIAGGVAKCWGDDYYGEVGDGNFGSSMSVLSPATVMNSMGSTAQAKLIAVGDSHACAAYSNATVWCWGHNENDQLGATTTTKVGGGTDPGSAVAVRVSGLSLQATSLAAGGEHSCAVLQNGSVFCWGDNYVGDLGNNSLTKSATPVQVVPW